MDQAKSIIASMISSTVSSKFEQNSMNMRSIIQLWNKAGNKGAEATLHNYQIEALIKTWEQADRDCFSETMANAQAEPMLIVAPTGSGKTGVIVFLPYVLSAKKALILTPSVVITEQIRAQFVESPSFFEKIKMFEPKDRDQWMQKIMEEPKVIKSPSDANTQSNLVIVNAQKFGGKSGLSLVHQDETIVKNARKFFARFDILIVDEAHHYTAVTWQKIMEEFQRPGGGVNKRVVFLTATPYKYEGNGKKRVQKLILGEGKAHRIVYNIAREMLVGVTIRKCIFEESTHAGTPDIIFKDLQKIFSDQMKNENRFVPQAMIRVWLREDAHNLAKDLNDHFEELPDPEVQSNRNLESFAAAVVGADKKNLQKFSEGKFRVLITCGIGLEGYDNPKVVACVILRKIVTGRMLFEQFVGRCMRINRQVSGNEQDKTVAVVRSYPEFEQQIIWKELFDNPVIANGDEDANENQQSQSVKSLKPKEPCKVQCSTPFGKRKKPNKFSSAPKRRLTDDQKLEASQSKNKSILKTSAYPTFTPSPKMNLAINVNVTQNINKESTSYLSATLNTGVEADRGSKNIAKRKAVSLSKDDKKNSTSYSSETLSALTEADRASDNRSKGKKVFKSREFVLDDCSSDEHETDGGSDDGSVELGPDDSSSSEQKSDDGSVELGSDDTSASEHESGDESSSSSDEDIV